MTTYRYKAYNNAGRTLAGEINAAGAKDAVEKLKSTGLFPIAVSELSTQARKKKVTANALAHVTRQLSTLLSSGTNLTEALAVIIENLANPALKAVFIDVKDRVLQGSSLAKALEPHSVFSPFYRGLIAAGEASGSLDAILPKLADYLEKRAAIVRDVKTAVTYPALMALVGVTVISFLFAFVIPKITGIFTESGATLPLITVILMGITTLFRDYWPVMIAIGAAGAFVFTRYRTHPDVRPVVEKFLFRLPWFGAIARDFYIASMARTLGTLLKGGVQMLKALDITKDALDSPAFDRILGSCAEDCMSGAALSAALKKHPAIPQILVHMTAVGERSGTIDEMLLKAAEAFEADFEAGIKKSLALLEPVLILGMGIIVGFIVLAILLPIFRLNQLIG